LSEKSVRPFPVLLPDQQCKKEANMKCYTVTKDGIVPGIQFLREPYPHVAVGDPALSSADCRRVEIDAALAAGATDGVIKTSSYTLDSKKSGNRRSSYKLVVPTGNDDDQALVKLEACCAAAGCRAFYDLPLNTLALANGWCLADGKGPQVSTPVNLVVLKKGDEVRIYRTVDIRLPAELVFSVSFNGSELRQNRPRAAA
jgi:hypothetical protein